MKKISILLLIVFSGFSFAKDTAIKNIDYMSVLKSESNLQLNKTINKAIADAQVFSTSRMQRIMEHSLKFEPRIVGGRETEIGNYPWMVSFAYYGQNGKLKSFCGGSLVDKKWVLTAAHCEIQSTDVVIIGRHDLTQGNGTVVNIRRFVPHEQYNSNTSDKDIALVELELSVETVAPIALNQSTNIVDGTSVTVIGWGHLSEGGLASNTLQEVSVPTVPHNLCKNSYSNLTENMLCAGEQQGGKDSCQGDSGGPLIKKINNKWTQVGVVSFGIGCARENYYGVYTRVSNFSNWITLKITSPELALQ